jgi:hypothetical protein
VCIAIAPCAAIVSDLPDFVGHVCTVQKPLLSGTGAIGFVLHLANVGVKVPKAGEASGDLAGAFRKVIGSVVGPCAIARLEMISDGQNLRELLEADFASPGTPKLGMRPPCRTKETDVVFDVAQRFSTSALTHHIQIWMFQR